MGALLAGKPRFAALRKTLRAVGRLPGKGDCFSSNELKPVAAQRATRPIPPEQRRRRWQRWWQRRRGQSRSHKRINRQRPEDGTDPARFFGGGMFLTLLTQGTNAAEANATRVQHAQRAIVFRSAFLRVERPGSLAAQGSDSIQPRFAPTSPSPVGRSGDAARLEHGAQ
jgi:hypothetical protein